MGDEKDAAVNVVQKQLDAYNNRNIEEFVACFSDSIAVLRQGDSHPQFHGKEELRRRYAALFASSPKLHCELKQRISVGEYVIDEEQITGASKYEGGLHSAAIYHVIGGSIQSVWFCR